jgi:hypothetical protein
MLDPVVALGDAKWTVEGRDDRLSPGVRGPDEPPPSVGTRLPPREWSMVVRHRCAHDGTIPQQR